MPTIKTVAVALVFFVLGVGAGLIVTGRYTIVARGQGFPVRMDKWTGETCVYSPQGFVGCEK